MRLGRVSKRRSSMRKAAEQQFIVSTKAKRYKAGIYARLSSDQGYKSCMQDEKNESETLKSESLEVQIEIAKKFVEAFNQNKTGEIMDVVCCYTDLGKTGSNFKREGFLQLLEDIRLGRIDCVIVKDLSRFGRNYLEAGNYIEKIFPFLGVRFIAVSDGFDTGKGGSENNQMSTAMAVEIKNLVNDMYAKDFSKKAKIHLKQRRKEGSYVGGPPPYGYTADWNGKRRVLIPDDNTAVIVPFIYEKFVETESYAAVADELNRRKINPPAIYKKTGHVYHSPEAYHSFDNTEYKGWDKSSVERILCSETYTGTLVQGKSSITARDEKNRIHKPKEEWVITKDAHEPLIAMELYQKVVEIRKDICRKTASHKHPTRGCPIEENIFDRILYCGVCGRKMTRNSHIKQYADGEKVRLDGYFCLNGGQTKVMVCPDSNRISKAELVDILLSLIRMDVTLFSDQGEKYVEFGNEQILKAIRKAEASLKKTEGKMRRFCEEEGCVYMDYRAGNIPQKDYVIYKMKQEDKLSDLRKAEEGQKKEIKALKESSERYLSAIKALLKLKTGKELTKEMLEAFISQIYVYPGKRIEILFTFTADWTKG